MEGKTSTGFEFTVAEGANDDMELLDALVDLDEGNISGMRKVLVRLLGEDGRKALYEHCRDKSGRVPVTRIVEEIKDIFDAMPKEVKN